MKTFKRKQFTIQEGHYTGPKDMDKVPGAIEVIGKSALAGTGIGAVVGNFIPDTGIVKGAVTGGKTGTVAGIFFKLLLNYLHNPMSSIKYRNVDKMIRREFGIYQMAGVTVGDSISTRDKLDDKFSFNDRDVCNYKLNFVISDNSVIMYTFGMTDAELTKTSNTLDYYCKKYVGMEYTSLLINRKMNAYSVSIVFTNYQVISNFIMELSKVLLVKINILDNKAIVDLRIKKESEEKEEGEKEEEKTFSFMGFGKYDLIKLLMNGGAHFLKRGNIGDSVLGIISGILNKLTVDELAKIPGINLSLKDLNNSYLKETLKRLHYINGVNYVIGDNDSEANMSLISGIFIVSVAKKTDADSKIEKGYYKKFLPKLKKIDTGDVIIYSYPMASKKEFDLLLKTLLGLGIRINLFDK